MALSEEKKDQIIQRGEFQYGLLQFNLVIAGAITCMALKEGADFRKGLLLVPVLSFLVFLLWLHHAVVIRLMNWQQPAPWSFWQALRVGTFSVAVMGNFVGIPVGCVLLYRAGVAGFERAVSKPLDLAGAYVLPSVSLVLFLLWLWLQYFRKKAPPAK